MKILWLYANVPNVIIKKYNLPEQNGGGWVTSLLDHIIADKKINMGVCFPIYKGQNLVNEVINDVSYFPFYPKEYNELKYSLNVENQLIEIIKNFKPDIVHVFGTETQHALPMIKAFNNPSKTIINLQGMTSIVAKHYFSNIPIKYLISSSFKDFIKWDNIVQQKRKFDRRGVFEIEALQSVENVIGRTEWDKACSTFVNPKLNYFHCDEILRDVFYYKKWNFDKCEKYSIFMSQAWYPIKGIHYVLEALSIIIRKYPKVMLYVAGDDFTKKDTMMANLKLSSYAKYIIKLIKRYNLSNNIQFTGPMNANEISDFMCTMNVVVVSSTIENESNTISEAKILGVPVVASYVGGMVDRIQHNVDGFQYQHDAPYMLAYYVEKLFSSQQLCEEFSEKARENTFSLCDKTVNMSRLYDIYNAVEFC